MTYRNALMQVHQAHIDYWVHPTAEREVLKKKYDCEIEIEVTVDLFVAIARVTVCLFGIIDKGCGRPVAIMGVR